MPWIGSVAPTTGCTRCPRAAMPRTSPRRSSAWPAWRRRRVSAPKHSPRSSGSRPPSRAYGDARRRRAELLAAALDDEHALADLAAAATELDEASMEAQARSTLRLQILGSALDLVRRRGPNPQARIAGVAADEPSLRQAMEQAYREAARLNDDQRERVRLVDLANDVRPRTLL